MNAETGDPVPSDWIVRGCEVEEGHFILFDDKELENNVLRLFDEKSPGRPP